MSEGTVEEPEAELGCALEGCELPLPARPLDEQGRRRAGRRPRYCSKAHADQASRQRRATDVAAVTEPLTQAQALGERLLPVSGELLDLVRDLIERLKAAERGAVGQIAGAEAEATAARLDAAEARAQAEAAEQARRRTLSQEREALKAKDAAEREAAGARGDADRIKAEAWEQVAAHERVRGQAEAARAAAESEVQGLVADLRRVREALQREQSQTATTSAQLAAALQDTQQARAAEATAVASVRLLESARAEAVAERDRLLVEVDRVRAELTDARTSAAAAQRDSEGLRGELARSTSRLHELVAQMADERHRRELAEQRLEDSRQAVAAGEERLADLQSLLKALRDSQT